MAVNPKSIANLRPPKKGDPSPNPNGRPRKLATTIIAELKERGLAPLTKAQFIEYATFVAGADEATLLEMSLQTDNVIFATLAKIMIAANSAKTTGRERIAILAPMLDMIYGKETVKIDLDFNTNIAVFAGERMQPLTDDDDSEQQG